MALDYLKNDYNHTVRQTVDAPINTLNKERKSYLVKFSVLLIAILITCVIAYNLWMPKIVSKTTDIKPGLTAIIHDATNPSAIIDGQVVKIGDTIGRRRIVKIDVDAVTLQKGQKTFQMMLR